MTDLIYCGHTEKGRYDWKLYEQCKAEISSAYPEAKFEDASDGVHGARLSIYIPIIEEEEFDTFLLQNGYFNISFRLQMLKYSEFDYLKRLVGKINSNGKRLHKL